MKSPRAPFTALFTICTTLAAAATFAAEPARDYSNRVTTVTGTPGCVAFWDFVQREPAAPHRFIAHVPAGATNRFPLDAGNYVHDLWGEGRTATYGKDIRSQANFPGASRQP